MTSVATASSSTTTRTAANATATSEVLLHHLPLQPVLLLLSSQMPWAASRRFGSAMESHIVAAAPSVETAASGAGATWNLILFAFA